MPSYSPSESQTTSSSVVVGLSPKSQAAFEARDRHRNRIPDDDFFEDLDEKDKEEEEDEDSFTPSYDSEEDDGGVFTFECDFPTPSKHKKPINLEALTFWYGNEDEMHIKRIFSEYEKALSSSFTCTHKTDARRLPLFIGSIKRTPLMSDEINLSTNVLATLDEIGIYRRDIRQCGSHTTLVKVLWSLTTWDSDGLPRTFQKLPDESAKKKMCMAMTKQKTKYKKEPSYLYAFPVWESKTEFKYIGSTQKVEIGYADQPFNYTPFLPKEYFDDDLEPDCQN